MNCHAHILNVLKGRALASPSFSFREIGKQYRITFSNLKNKTSFLVQNDLIRMFSVEHYDWRFFVKFTDMQGQNDYVLIEEFNDWLLSKTKELQPVK